MPELPQLGRVLVVLGLALGAFGLLLSLGGRLPWLGRLPGDLVIERPGLRLYLPIASCVLLSLLVSAVLWLLRR